LDDCENLLKQVGKNIDDLLERAKDVQEELDKLDDADDGSHPSKQELQKQLKQIQRQIKEQLQQKEDLQQQVDKAKSLPDDELLHFNLDEAKE